VNGKTRNEIVVARIAWIARLLESPDPHSILEENRPYAHIKSIALRRRPDLPCPIRRRKRPVIHPDFERWVSAPRARGQHAQSAPGNEIAGVNAVTAKCATYICCARQAEASAGAASAGGRERNAEQGEFEAKALARRRGKMSGDVPPLVRKGGMRAVVARKLKFMRRESLPRRPLLSLANGSTPSGAAAAATRGEEEKHHAARAHHSSRIACASGARALFQAG